MSCKSKSPTWPYLVLLLCLFALSATAPRAWQRTAHKQPLLSILAARQQSGQSKVVAPPSVPVAKTDGGKIATSAKPSTPEASVSQVIRTAPSPEINPSTPAIEVPARSPEPATVAPIEVAALPTPIGNQADLTLPSVEPPPDEATPTDLAKPAPTWPIPVALIEQLDALDKIESSARWAEQAAELIHQCCFCQRDDRDQPQATLLRLRELNSKAEAILANKTQLAANPQWLRATRALTRRLDIWECVPNLIQSQGRPTAIPAGSTERLLASVDKVEALTSNDPQASAWHDYLMLDQLRKFDGPRVESAAQSQIAKTVLKRISKANLSRQQRAVLSREPVAALAAELEAWAADPVDAAQLLADLERYEQTGLTSDAQRIASACRSLRASADDDARELGSQVASHYRDANVRLAISGKLVNRMVPPPYTVDAPVRDTIFGARVRGSSSTLMKLSVRLVPDPNRIRLGLEATGIVDSDTAARSGPATFYSEGQSSFIVQKLLLVGPGGLKVWPAIANADSYYNDLLDVKTDYDGLPVIGSLVRGIARSKHEESRGQARGETENKIATKARRQLDAEVQSRLDKTQDKLNGRMATLDRLGLAPQPVDFSTTDERIAMRMRVAGDDQLGAQTERPWAPSDSLLSLQIHQSALNNALARLELDGRTFDVPELFTWMRTRLGFPAGKLPEDLPEGVRLTFAKSDALRVRCDQGRIELTIALAELTDGQKRWRNFTVRTNFRPTTQGLNVELERDGTIFLGGESLKGKPQIVLRGIFSKVLPRDRRWSLIDEKIVKDARLSDLEVNQLVVEDGWIGVAFSAGQEKSGASAGKPRRTTR